MSENVMTPEFRLSYPNLLQPRLNDLNGKMEYSVVALFPKGADLKALKAEATRAIHEKWGTDQTKWPKNLRSPFRDQGEKDSEGYEAGAVFLNLKSNNKPGIVDANLQPIIDPSQVYAGCYGRATVRAYSYSQKGNNGVAFGLQNFQKTRDGESLSGRMKPEEEFEPIAAAANASEGGAAVDIFGV